MNTNDPDIVEMDFPPYVEEYSPFPDVELDFNFEENKEEIYRRNRIIAAEEQAKLLKEEERKRLEKQEQFREMTEAAKAADMAVMAAHQKHYWDKLALPVSIITVCAIIALIVVLSGRLSKPSVSVQDWIDKIETDSIWDEMRLTKTETTVYTPPEPFGERVYLEEHTICTTDKMSYLFFPRYTWDNKFRVNVNIRNLTEEKYFIMFDSLYITDGKNRSYDYEKKQRSSGNLIYTFEDEEFHADMEPIGLTFGSSGECSFTLEFPADWFENNSYISFGYDGGHLSVKPEDETIKFIEDFETQIYYYNFPD